MRGPFNDTCDIFCGPGSPTPNVLRGTFACRFVPADGIFLIGPDAPTRIGWITLDAIIPTGMWTPPDFSVDAGVGDVFAVPSGTTPQFFCLFTEEVLWRSQPLYYRANVCLLPRPHADAILQENLSIIELENGFYLLK